MSMACAESGEFDAAIAWQRKAAAIYDGEHRNRPCPAHKDGVLWLQSMLESFQNHRPFRDNGSEVGLDVIEEVRQPPFGSRRKSPDHAIEKSRRLGQAPALAAWAV